MATNGVVRSRDGVSRIMGACAVIVAIAAIVALVLLYAGVGGSHLGTEGPTGTAGPGGSQGPQGPQGPPGIQGPPGFNSSWVTLNFTFNLTGKAANASITNEQTVYGGHGTYDAAINLTNSGNVTLKVIGLSFPTILTPALYYAGADPTIGEIFAYPNSTVTFVLAFQATADAGALAVPVTIDLNLAPTTVQG